MSDEPFTTLEAMPDAVPVPGSVAPFITKASMLEILQRLRNSVELHMGRYGDAMAKQLHARLSGCIALLANDLYTPVSADQGELPLIEGADQPPDHGTDPDLERQANELLALSGSPELVTNPDETTFVAPRMEREKTPRKTARPGLLKRGGKRRAA